MHQNVQDWQPFIRLIVTNYLRKQPSLRYDDAYSAALWGMHKAIQTWDQRKSTIKFTTYARCKMIHEIIDWMRWSSPMTRIQTKLSKNNEHLYSLAHPLPLYDFASVNTPDKSDTTAPIQNRLFREKLCNLLTDYEQNVLKRHLDGLTNREISLELNCHESLICYHLRKAYKKIATHHTYEELAAELC